MLRKFFQNINGQAHSITSAAVIIGGASLASKFFGVFRDRVLAGEFGAGRALDIYYASFRIPDFVYNLLVLGILSAGFIPIFTDSLKNGKQGAWDLVNHLLTIIFFVLIAVCGILIFLTPKIMIYVTPGFSPQDLKITSDLTRIMFLSPIFLGVAGIFGGILQSFRRFFIFSLAPIMYNIGIIIGALFFTPKLGIYGLAWGVVLGAVLHLLVQVPSIWFLGYRPKLGFEISRDVRKIFGMTVPRILSLIITQAHLMVITVIGSTLASGSIAIFNFANNLQSVPLVIFGISFSVAAFPALSDYAVNKEKFIETLSLTLRQILFFVIPASALLILLRAQIVRVALGSGNFGWNDTIHTINTLAIFSVSLFAQSLIHLLSRTFFAMKDSITPFCVGLLSTILNIFLSLYLVKTFTVWQVESLAFAYSIASIFNLLILWLLLKLKIGEIDETRIFYSSLKIGISAFIMTLAIQGVKYAIEPFFGTHTFLGIAIQGTAGGIVGILVYFLACLSLRSPEAILFLSSFQKKFLRKFTPTEPMEGA